MMNDAVTTRIAVLGASGYAGGEVLRLLAPRGDVDVTFLGAKESAGRSLADVHPHLASLPLADTALQTIEVDTVVASADVVFSSLPHGASAHLAPAMLDAGLRVIDLAGDFRLPADCYPEWYGFDHPAKPWLDKAVYELPELFGDRVEGAQLIANPGCFPTPVILGCAPLLAAGLIEPGPILVDGKTGLSGAGKAANENTIYRASQDSVRPYRLPRHQHTPEMERGIDLATGLAPPVLFAPHLVPTVRGVLVTCYAPAAGGVSTDQLTDALVAAYADRPFVRVLPSGQMADSKRVRGTNVVELQVLIDPRTGTAVIVGALDNLVRGAAGQAIQNYNLSAGLDEATDLPTLAVYP